VGHLQSKSGAALSFDQYVKPEIEFWIKKFDKVRTKSAGPVFIALRTYALFRDGMASGWTSSTHLDQRLQQVEESLATKMQLRAAGVEAGEPKPGPTDCKVWIPV